MIRLESITFAYNSGSPIFQDFSWEVNSGSTWAVIGSSGCGKSTLLYLLTGLRFPIKGELFIDGKVLTRPRPQTGLIIQDYGLLPWATVIQNVAIGSQIRGFYGPDGTHAPQEHQGDPKIEFWINRLNLSHIAEKYPSQISGGQRQRTAIARTLVLQPDLLVMDEPFSSLDAPTRESLQNLILELQVEHNLTLVIVTHTIEEAAIMGKKILLLNNPPNRNPEIIDNPGIINPQYRQSSVYIQLCRYIRSRLENS
jgi:NitT/TauT family transport system ATP-binding protein